MPSIMSLEELAQFLTSINAQIDSVVCLSTKDGKYSVADVVHTFVKAAVKQDMHWSLIQQRVNFVLELL